LAWSGLFIGVLSFFALPGSAADAGIALVGIGFVPGNVSAGTAEESAATRS
jgi:hypothetical protein